MKAILDTHAFIWMDADPSKISPTVLGYLNDPLWTVYLSVVSIWEIVIKLSVGKLTLSDDLEKIVNLHLATTPLTLLPVEFEHVLEVRRLPLIHKDPFDRMLVAQANSENATLLTQDFNIRLYPVRTDW